MFCLSVSLSVSLFVCVGEMDYSFSLAVARLRPPGSHLVATSYLKAHDPLEPETYPSEDGERASYRRRTLPDMNGALHRTLQEIAQLGAKVLHGIDATDLRGSLVPAGIESAFEYIIFPFPRASLIRSCDPRNSKLLRDFFLSVASHGFLSENGVVQLVMLGTQYEAWDVANMAGHWGFYLFSRVALPQGFYQSREVSGKPWNPSGAELLNFCSAKSLSACQLRMMRSDI